MELCTHSLEETSTYIKVVFTVHGLTAGVECG